MSKSFLTPTADIEFQNDDFQIPSQATTAFQGTPKYLHLLVFNIKMHHTLEGFIFDMSKGPSLTAWLNNHYFILRSKSIWTGWLSTDVS